MNRILFCLLMALAGLVHAVPQPVSLSMSAPLLQFSQAVFKDMLHRDYVIAPDVLVLDRKITIQIRSIDIADVPQFVEGVLASQGIAVTERSGIYYLNLASKDAPVTPVLPLAFDGDAVPKVAPLSHAKAVAEKIEPVEFSYSVYKPRFRTAEFLASVAAVPFGRSAVHDAGGVLLLSGEQKILDKITALLAVLDVHTNMVEVAASWVEVTETEGSVRGVSLVANVLGAKLGVSVGDRSTTSAISIKSTSFEMVLNALNTDGRFKQISNSRVSGDNATKLSLNVGDETPTLTSTGKDNAGNAVQNIVYRQSGVIVDVLPRLLDGGQINLVVDGQISSFKQTVNGVSGSPTLIKRQVKTVVTVGDGDVLVLGGLTDSQSTNSADGFAFLPSSWRAKNSSGVKTDVVLIICAKGSKS